MEKRISNWEELKSSLREKYQDDERYSFRVNPINDDIYIDIDNERLRDSLTITKNNNGLSQYEWLVAYNRTCQQLYYIVINLLEINEEK